MRNGIIEIAPTLKVVIVPVTVEEMSPEDKAERDALDQEATDRHLHPEKYVEQ